jgi:hypothetical protein
MNCDELSLREMMRSVFGSGVGQIILEKVIDGEPVVIAKEDGSTLTLTNSAETLRLLLERFEWRPEPPQGPVDGSDHEAASYLVSVCRRMAASFSLYDVIAHVMLDRPAFVLEFAPIWRGLILKRRICGATQGDLICYRLA